MRKWRAWLMVLALPAPGLWPSLGLAQDLSSEPIYTNLRRFHIPFKTPATQQNRLKQLQLYFSTDQGRTWQASAIVAPDQDAFKFQCDRDGMYWFTVRTLDKDNIYNPPTLQGSQPSLKVVVDTVPPDVRLRHIGGRPGEVGVAWEIRDENLDLRGFDAIRLEYRAAGTAAWTTLHVNPAAGQHYWNPETNAALEVRLRARDRAGNTGEASTNVIVGQRDAGPPPFQGGGGALPFGFPGDVERRLVNNKRISLNYELKELGPSGVSTVDLWYTQDGRSWNRFPMSKQAESGPPARPLVFEVEAEGIYGFTLVAKSGVGLSERPPQIGDRPQVWVEVDLTKPVVQIQEVAVGQGMDKGKLTVSWSARDKNLGANPVTISYAEQAAGPWKSFVQNIANSGRYVVSLPEMVPYQFYVRIEAVDQAGNVGESITQEMVKVDLALPKVKILSVGPAGR
jgi:hypothetical protein